MAHQIEQRENTTDIGTIKIHNNVIRSVASTAATDVGGVYKMGDRIGKNIFDALFRKQSTHGVKVLSEDGEVTIKLSIIVEYGVDIPTVADHVQKNVKAAVEKMAGLSVAAVDVSIEGVHKVSTSDVIQQI